MRPLGRKGKTLEDTAPLLGQLLPGGFVYSPKDWVGQRGVEVEWDRRLHVLLTTYFSENTLSHLILGSQGFPFYPFEEFRSDEGEGIDSQPLESRSCL